MTSRMRSWHLPALFWLLGLAITTHVHAEEGVLGGAAANLVPLRSTEVVLRSEAIELALSPDEQTWHVRAQYELANDGARARTVQLGFPEFRCEFAASEDFDPCVGDGEYRAADMQLLVRGEAVKPRRSPISGKPAWAPPQAQAWLFDVQFAPGETVPIEHRYVVPASQSDDGAIGASYVTRTGALWSKPIERASFTFLLPVRSCLVVEPQNIARRSRKVVLREGAGTPWLQLVFAARNWVPKDDLALHFETCVPARDTELTGCPLLDELARFAYPPAGPVDPDTPAAISRAELKARLGALDPATLERCDDAVFRAYAAYYNAQELAVFARQPAAARHYSAPLLTEDDWRWVGLVDEVIRERAAQPSKPTAAAPAHADAGGCSSSGAGEHPDPQPGSGYAFLLATFLLLAFRRVK